MNVRDSEVIAGLLGKEGYQRTTIEQEASVIIYNTCSVRQHAENKVWSGLGKFRKAKTDNRKAIIGLVGCMAQNYKEAIFERAPQVDFIVGPSDIHKIPEIVNKFRVDKAQLRDRKLLERKIWETNGSIRPEEIYHSGFREDKNHAYVVISEGCSNFCSYCIVPYVRGRLRNRDYKDIIKEIEEAVDREITNITLLGQNVNAYKSAVNFIELLKLVNDINGLKQFSFITSHPRDTSIDLFKAMASLGKIKKYLHLPVQSGSERILQLMKRGYTRRFYLDLIRAYRKIVKDGILTSDIIVGFPGEKEEDFQDTYNLMKQVEFDSAYIFKYSPRPHTQAENLPDDVPQKEKERRHQLILALQKDISKRRRGNA
ncbi:MAG: tRNA (N6-isopentenyl adenosine(37)-C2)-methylthiotransferase MiaB [Candidatus Omnitrophica bacterium]|nr:tRNA (N6-isopentenyl adenosine(37)-C2)-methylthiotransferase MiaB [Candidatus Omnitrophota bacterium]